MRIADVEQQIMDGLLEMILIFDRSGQIVYANRQAKDRLEYGDDLVSCSIANIYPNDVTVENGLIHPNEGLDTELKEQMAYRKNQTCFPTMVKCSPYGDSGELLLCSALDNTMISSIQKELDQEKQKNDVAQETKTEFVANVTHELRTPVNGILGNTKELEEMEDDKEKMRRLKLIHRGCDDMHALINGILDFSKLDAGKLELEQREFDVRQMIDYIRSNHLPKITEKGVDLTVTVSPEVPETIVGDELRIQQIVNNLMSNATKFTTVGRITLEVFKTAQIGNRCELFFMVRDTGVGIKPEDLGKLFHSFTQVDASVTRQYGGTGLGLNISKQLANLMQGEINVQSEYGKGSVFSFNIWVGLTEKEAASDAGKIDAPVFNTGVVADAKQDAIWTYGTPENTEEIHKKLSKLSLSVDMENWEKAEMFAEMLKQLIADAPAEIRPLGLRMKMAVQKADRAKALDYLEKLEEALS